jgi:iron complex outermembrane receptor protein
LVHSLALSGLATHALAQQAPAPQRIEITGSSIKRVAAEGALPVQIITRKELERDGIVSAEQLISNLNINGNGLDNLASNADVVGGAQRGNNGATSANLRGQGSSATLILLNGRRVAAHGLNGAAVDLNQIPFAAIERVEVLKDGASAIYGTDAIGGVINFILRRDFNGLSANARIDATEAGGGNIFTGGFVAGFGDLNTDGFNLMATVGVRSNKALRGDQRDFVNTFQPDRGLSVDTRGTPFATILPFSGSIIPSSGAAPFVPGSTTQRASGGINVLDLPGGLGCGAIDGMAPYDDLLWDFPAAQFACSWDTGRAAVLQQPVDNTNLVLAGNLKAGDHLIKAEFTASSTDSAKRFSNLQLTPSSARPLRYPFNPDTAATYTRVFDELVATFPELEAQRGLPISYRWRCIECGPREIETTTDTARFFIGADGPLAGDWDYRVGASSAYSESQSTLGGGYYYTRTTTDADGNVIANGIVEALNTGLINVFLLPGEQQSAAGLAALEAASARGVTLYGGKFSLTQIDAATSGPVFKLPAGDVMAAVGVDFRKEKLTFNGDARAADARPQILAAPFDDANAVDGVTRDVKALYGELLVPVTKDLEITAALRTDDYSGFGRSTNPKLSLRYSPSPQWLIRGSYNTGFRVPTFNQIFNPASSSQYTGRDLVDPLTCPSLVPSSTDPGCTALGIDVDIINGGKTDLGPEEAKQFSLGVIFEPSRHFSIGLDWWSINRTNTIQILGLEQLQENFALFPQNFLRDSTGKLVAIDQRWVNAGETETSGLELSVRGNAGFNGGTLLMGADVSYLLEKRSRVVASAPFGDSEIGQFTFSGDLGLRWKHTAFVTYNKGDWSTTLTQVYRSGYKDQVSPGVASGTVSPINYDPKVKPYEIFHLSVAYSGIKNLTVSAGIKNVFNTDPPFANNYDSNFGSGSSWEPRVADPRGRSYAIGVEYKFF